MFKKLLSIAIISSAGLMILPLAAAATNSYGTTSQTLAVGKTMSVGLSPLSSATWQLGSNASPAVASASVSQSAVIVKALSAGSDSISVCASNNSGCLQINLTVTTGQVLGESTVNAHPAGSWVLGPDGRTVFYVASNGLIPITTWSIFLSNGGKSSGIVTANSADMNLPLLPLMQPHDSRV